MMQRERALDIGRKLETSVAGAVPVLVEFLRDEIQKTGHRNAIFGLSGGIDSAVVAYLAVLALGKDHVFPLIMPYKESSQTSLNDARQVLSDLDLPERVIDITPQVDAYFASQASATPLRRGNKMARERMSIIYDQSAAYQALPLGTSNKTELLLGYGTQFGDLASALNPVGDLYKTQVRAIAEQLGVPDSIQHKAPSADLWQNQTDEEELGFSYEDADAILHLLVDERLTEDEVVLQGFRGELIGQVALRIRINQYKRRMPVIAKVSSRTIGIDFRYPRDWGM